MKKCFIYIQFLVVTLLLSISTMAQPGGDGDPGCDPADPTCVPLDNGVMLLIAIAVIIALKKAYDYKKSVAI
jgi:hypothetical protein